MRFYYVIYYIYIYLKKTNIEYAFKFWIFMLIMDLWKISL